MESSDVPVLTLAADYPRRHRVPRHRHDRAQLVYASSGVMRVSTSRGIWVVPPQRAVWIPEGIEHEIDMACPVSMRTLYVASDARPELPRNCSVVQVSPLLREMILRMMITNGCAAQRKQHLIEVLLDELATMSVAPLELPRPRDPRLVRLTDALEKDPGNSATLSEWGKEVGASSRTLARLFTEETRMTFRKWREQLRLVSAIERLAAGEQVTTVAMELGYDSVSAFIHMFRRNLGATPSRYFEPQ